MRWPDKTRVRRADFPSALLLAMSDLLNYFLLDLFPRDVNDVIIIMHTHSCHQLQPTGKANQSGVGSNYYSLQGKQDIIIIMTWDVSQLDDISRLSTNRWILDTGDKLDNHHVHTLSFLYYTVYESYNINY